jgi:hypothetical protein
MLFVSRATHSCVLMRVLFFFEKGFRPTCAPRRGLLLLRTLCLLNLLGFSRAEANHTWNVGFESQIHRQTVTPSFFPILNLGFALESHSDVEARLGATTEWRADAQLRMSPTHPQAFAITSQNAYYGDLDHSQETPLRFTFGRRLVGWSGLDSLWGLGEFEPLDNWDRLRARPQGLTGIFAYTETQQLRVRAFFSYLSFPETNPNIVIQNNRFALEHPQSISNAPQTYSLINRPTPLGYELVIPSVHQIILRPSFAFSLETRAELPIQAKLSYGYLPMNYFPIALQGKLGIDIDQIVVKLHPRLVHHHVYNGEISYRFDDSTSTGLMVMVKDPVQEPLPTDYTTSILSTSTTWSPWIQYELGRLKLQLAHLWTFGGLEADVGPFAESRGSIFSSRLLYRNATQIKARTTLGVQQRDSLEARYVHEYSIQGDWIAFDYVHQFKSGWSMLVGGDLIQSSLGAAADRGAEFLADIRAIDRLRIGVQYVF